MPPKFILLAEQLATQLAQRVEVRGLGLERGRAMRVPRRGFVREDYAKHRLGHRPPHGLVELLLGLCNLLVDVVPGVVADARSLTALASSGARSARASSPLS